jgi:hypothetical protein
MHPFNQADRVEVLTTSGVFADISTLSCLF